MRARPHIEPAALLAAHGHALAATHLKRRPYMPHAVRYALLPELSPTAKPVVFPDLDSLARRIHRDRDGQTLDLTEIEDLELQGRPDATRGVAVWTLDAGNDRDRFLGFAWLDGGGLQLLQLGLRRARLEMGEAA
jgi:hypothetical protein